MRFASIRFMKRLWQSDSSDSDVSDVEDPSLELCEMLQGLYMKSTLTAVQVCVLCFWIVKAGGRGQVESFAKKPQTKSRGHYARH